MENKCFMCDSEIDYRLEVCEDCGKLSNRLKLIKDELSKSHKGTKVDDTDAELYKQYGGLYWKKYWALRKIVREVSEKNDKLDYAMTFLEWATNDQTKKELQIAISEYIKEQELKK